MVGNIFSKTVLPNIYVVSQKKTLRLRNVFKNKTTISKKTERRCQEYIMTNEFSKCNCANVVDSHLLHKHCCTKVIYPKYIIGRHDELMDDLNNRLFFQLFKVVG